MPYPPHAAGPAFPTPFPNSYDGISVRDYFAAAALTGICAGGHSLKKGVDNTQIAEACYAMADAMIARLKMVPPKAE